MKILVPLAEGFEEIEAVTIIDVLRRAGAEVITAAIKDKKVTGAHNITILAESLLRDVNPEDLDCIVLPGGMPGTINLKESAELMKLLNHLSEKARLIGAICAAPTVLDKAGLINNRKITCHPSVKEELINAGSTGKPIEVDGKIVTGRAAGSAMKFALTLVNELFGQDKVNEINRTLLSGI